MQAETRIARTLPVARLPPAAHRNQDGIRRLGLFPQRTRKRVTADLGQAEIEKSEVRLELPRDLERLLGIVRNADLVADAFEQQRQARHEVDVVVHEQNPE